VQLFVISLKARQDRREQVARELADTGSDCRIIDAVEGAGQLQRYFRGANTLQYLLETGWFPSPTEINCYASHLQLWKHCVSLAKPIVIMEDDFRATGDFNRVLQWADTLIHDCGFIRLEALEPRWQKKPGFAPVRMRTLDDMTLYCQQMPSVRATCYALTPECAQALINVSHQVVAPVDHVIRRCWRHRQLLFAITPPAVTLSELADASSITGRRKHMARHLAVLLRPIYRLAERWRARRFIADRLQQP